jgi:hypothetical protein
VNDSERTPVEYPAHIPAHPETKKRPDSGAPEVVQTLSLAASSRESHRSGLNRRPLHESNVSFGGSPANDNSLAAEAARAQGGQRVDSGARDIPRISHAADATDPGDSPTEDLRNALACLRSVTEVPGECQCTDDDPDPCGHCMVLTVLAAVEHRVHRAMKQLELDAAGRGALIIHVLSRHRPSGVLADVLTRGVQATSTTRFPVKPVHVPDLGDAPVRAS